MQLDHQQQLPVLIGIGISLASIYFATKRSKSKKERRLSFTSVGLGIGSFPPVANVKEPIINTAVYFESISDCPSSTDVAQLIIQPLLEYERLSSVPDLDSRVCRPSSSCHNGNDGKVDPMDLIRELYIDGDETLLNKTIVEHCQDALGTNRNDLPCKYILSFLCSIIDIQELLNLTRFSK